MPHYPARAQSATSLTDTVYSQLTARAKQRGGKMHALHIGDTYRQPPEAARKMVAQAADQVGMHVYPMPHGERALIDALSTHIKTRSGVQRDADCVQVLAGATNGYTVVCNALLDPGDEVVLLSPYWPLIRGIVASRGAVAVELPFWTRLEDKTFDIETELERVITPRTVAIYVNDPNNPTGVLLPKVVQEIIVRIAQKHQLWIFADEAYEDLIFEDVERTRIWQHSAAAELSIVMHTFSKSYGMAGARVAYAHGPKDAMRAIRGVHTFQTYSAPKVMQHMALAALTQGAAWQDETRALYREAGAMAAAAVGIKAPSAGTFLFFDTQRFWRDGESVTQFLERCVDCGVLLTPGVSSGKDYVNWARLCFTVVPPDELREALDCLSQALR